MKININKNKQHRKSILADSKITRSLPEFINEIFKEKGLNNFEYE